MVLHRVPHSRLTSRWTKGQSPLFGRTLYERIIEYRSTSGGKWTAHLMVEFVSERKYRWGGKGWTWNVSMARTGWIDRLHASGYSVSAESGRRAAEAAAAALARGARGL